MNQTLAREDHLPFKKLGRMFVKCLRTVYIQGTTVVKILPSAEDIQLYYKLRRKSYDLQWSMDPGYRKGLNRLVELVVEEGDTVLDVGCGTGSATMKAAAKARQVVGIDLSPHMIELAEKKTVKKCLDNVCFTASSVEDYKPEEAFDKVISSFMIPHVKPHLRPAIYACMYGFLKPGGTVGLFGSKGEVCDVYETREEIEANLTEAGFTDIEIFDIYDIYRVAMARRPE